jgi:hypothetical protein
LEGYRTDLQCHHFFKNHSTTQMVDIFIVSSGDQPDDVHGFVG